MQVHRKHMLPRRNPFDRPQDPLANVCLDRAMTVCRNNCDPDDENTSLSFHKRIEPSTQATLYCMTVFDL